MRPREYLFNYIIVEIFVPRGSGATAPGIPIPAITERHAPLKAEVHTIGHKTEIDDEQQTHGSVALQPTQN